MIRALETLVSHSRYDIINVSTDRTTSKTVGKHVVGSLSTVYVVYTRLKCACLR